jgi:SOS response regulatory protein OraA/RecX
MVVVGSFTPSMVPTTYKQLNLRMLSTKKISRTTLRSKLPTNYMFKGEIDETILLMIVFF